MLLRVAAPAVREERKRIGTCDCRLHARVDAVGLVVEEHESDVPRREFGLFGPGRVEPGQRLEEEGRVEHAEWEVLGEGEAGEHLIDQLNLFVGELTIEMLPDVGHSRTWLVVGLRHRATRRREPTARGELLFELSRDLAHALAPRDANRGGRRLEVDCAESSRGLVRVVGDALRGDVQKPISRVGLRDPAAVQADGLLVLDNRAVLNAEVLEEGSEAVDHVLALCVRSFARILGEVHHVLAAVLLELALEGILIGRARIRRLAVLIHGRLQIVGPEGLARCHRLAEEHVAE